MPTIALDLHRRWGDMPKIVQPIPNSRGICRLKKPGIARQTPRVSITIRRTALAKRRLGRNELKHFYNWNDGQPETELTFKFYRQATNTIVGISDEAATFLRGFF
jgi:hypothetical protein